MDFLGQNLTIVNKQQTYHINSLFKLVFYWKNQPWQNDIMQGHKRLLTLYRVPLLTAEKFDVVDEGTKTLH